MAQATPFFDIQNNPFLNPEINPFAPQKMGEMLNGCKLDGFDFDAVTEAQRKNMEALSEAQSKTISGLQSAFAQQSNTMRDFMADTGEAWKCLGDTSTAAEKAQKQAEIVKKAMERSAASLQKTSDLVAKSQKDAFTILNKCASENMDTLKAGLKPAK